jgi:hypothetical protein
LAKVLAENGVGPTRGDDMPGSSQDVPFIVEQMAKCVRLSKRCSDPEIADHLLELARAFAQRALELGAHPDHFPAELKPRLVGLTERG